MTIINITEKTKTEALTIARNAIKTYLKTNSIPEINISNPQLNQTAGVFVTLKHRGQLRGCIGKIEANQPLYRLIQIMAVAAAFHDPRFPPLTVDELKSIKIEISLLTPKKKINDWRTIRLGIDGVIIENGGRCGVFLPQVATETSWSLNQFLAKLCSEKAGLSEDCYLDPNTNIYIFQTIQFSEDNLKRS